ncbi:Dimethylglycine oxidase (FAD dependent oxidoreductase) [Colletotrichum truncatum]|uniref:Dimethylglycine oxidase (FAD dependent oxidoreductase) n=1 Tax=Colletotrichum truncatum TaxID=5467 RepID=A0ACC3YYW1_COLTU|nr:Dimethylglycine oxidase (FAD dependent oxidoreductase) [Colletotrichum truncatum]KAF6781800.1 Dimethylglycine oxidase (FAD dependent oxidoreductase) [Colletotrichum truncatum]
MSQPPETIIIVGAGIVGSALAYYLSSSDTTRNIKLVDRSFLPLLGSTGHAPGFVGQFNESEVLTKLAIETVSEYTKIPGGFENVGGLEVAFQPEGVRRLESRCASALKLNLSAEILSIEKAHTLAPTLVRESQSGTALFFPTDGTANATKITSFYQNEAKSSGVHLIQGDITGLVSSAGRITGVKISKEGSDEMFNADKVILTTGIWAQDLCQGFDFPMPVVPVGHPYLYGKARDSLPQKIPFVRWPEYHTYARDHGGRYGLGSYDHAPTGCKPQNGTAIGEWIADFNTPLKSAIDLLPEATAEEFSNGESFNGIFSMTPDNMPLAGPVRSIEGLYMAVAVWVTHAAGTAKFLTRLIDNANVDQGTKAALDPERFKGQDSVTLEEKSLAGYNSI